MSGLRGLPFSASSWTIELNGEPDGSRPTRFHSAAFTRSSASESVNTLEMLWIEKGSSASPATWALPSPRTTASPSLRGSTCANAGM